MSDVEGGYNVVIAKVITTVQYIKKFKSSIKTNHNNVVEAW